MACQTTARVFSVRTTGGQIHHNDAYGPQFLGTHSNDIACFLSGTHIVINAQNDVSSQI